MLQIHDTRAGQVVPVQFGRLVRIYTCGPAVRRRAHLGDLRTHVLSDLVRRILERRRARVLACQNITDVGHLTDSDVDHEDAFRADATALNLRPPEHAPRASENVEPMIELVAKLVERGHAYTVPDGSVFFDVRTFPAYGELSGNRLEEPRPADWALWEPGDGELSWDSPWGRGVPGRHVACSALSLRFLGPAVDLHLGGIERCFPHDEAERAQSDAATGHEVVRHWVHGERLLFDGRAGSNVVPLSEVTAAGLDPLAVRMAFLEHHYRRRLDLTWDTLRAADRTLRHWRSRVAEWAESPSAPMAAGHVERVESALGDDLDTPAALRVLGELERDESVPPGAKLEAFLHVDQVLGLDLPIDIGKAPTLPAGAGELLEARSRAQEARDWTEADRLRDELAALGVRVSDTPGGQTWA
ncbi:cysteine--tRNA ligase [Nonomuraea wenchangensis]|uniref:CysS/YqeB C-terminal domain-containing protein n=1 Tax=Nonomuraea wenchangensis TaxID=568860 RepID=UPI003407A813